MRRALVKAPYARVFNAVSNSLSEAAELTDQRSLIHLQIEPPQLLVPWDRTQSYSF